MLFENQPETYGDAIVFFLLDKLSSEFRRNLVQQRDYSEGFGLDDLRKALRTKMGVSEVGRSVQ